MGKLFSDQVLKTPLSKATEGLNRRDFEDSHDSKKLKGNRDGEQKSTGRQDNRCVTSSTECRQLWAW